MANGKKLPSNAKLDLELQSHDFKFGVLTQARVFSVQMLFNLIWMPPNRYLFATVGFYWYLTDERRNKNKNKKLMMH